MNEYEKETLGLNEGQELTENDEIDADDDEVDAFVPKDYGLLLTQLMAKEDDTLNEMLEVDKQDTAPVQQQHEPSITALPRAQALPMASLTPEPVMAPPPPLMLNTVNTEPPVTTPTNAKILNDEIRVRIKLISQLQSYIVAFKTRNVDVSEIQQYITVDSQSPIETLRQACFIAKSKYDAVSSDNGVALTIRGAAYAAEAVFNGQRSLFGMKLNASGLTQDVESTLNDLRPITNELAQSFTTELSPLNRILLSIGGQFVKQICINAFQEKIDPENTVGNRQALHKMVNKN